jgi:hypothetical protein
MHPLRKAKSSRLLCFPQVYFPPCWRQVLAHCKDSEDPVTQAVAWSSDASHKQLSKLQQQLDSQQQEYRELRQEVHSFQVRASVILKPYLKATKKDKYCQQNVVVNYISR